MDGFSISLVGNPWQPGQQGSNLQILTWRPVIQMKRKTNNFCAIPNLKLMINKPSWRPAPEPFRKLSGLIAEPKGTAVEPLSAETLLGKKGQTSESTMVRTENAHQTPWPQILKEMMIPEPNINRRRIPNVFCVAFVHSRPMGLCLQCQI